MAVMMTQSTPPPPHKDASRLLPPSNMLYLHHEWIHQLMKGHEREREEKKRLRGGEEWITKEPLRRP